MTVRTPLRLADCGETLTPEELCRVLQISRSQYYELRRHKALRIPAIEGLGVTRYTNESVQKYLASLGRVPSKVSLRRVS